MEQSVHIVSNESREGECLDTEEGELEGVQQPHQEDVYAHDVRWEKRILDSLFVLHYLMTIPNQLSFSFSIQLKAMNLSIFCQGIRGRG